MICISLTTLMHYTTLTQLLGLFNATVVQQHPHNHINHCFLVDKHTSREATCTTAAACVLIEQSAHPQPHRNQPCCLLWRAIWRDALLFRPSVCFTTRSTFLVSEKDGTGAGGAAKVVLTPAATATIVTPNTQPNTHYTSSIPPTHATPAAATTTTTTTATPPPPPPSQPTQQKPVVVAAPPPSSPPSSSFDYSTAASQPRARSSIRSRITAFLVGVGVAGRCWILSTAE